MAINRHSLKCPAMVQSISNEIRPIENQLDSAPVTSSHPPGHRIQIFTFGTLRVIRDGHPVAETDWHTRQARQILKILITERPQPVATDRLIELLWPHSPPDAAATTLRSAINALRNVLEPERLNRAPARYIHTQAPGYAFRPHEDIWLDVAHFEQELRLAHTLQDPGMQADHLANALRLYEDDYLSGDPYVDWVKVERERLQELHYAALLQLAELHARSGNFTTAISACRQVLAVDPVRENAYQALMRYQAESGDSAAALLTYERCRGVLGEELGADPSPYTQQLHSRILNGEVDLWRNASFPSVWSSEFFWDERLDSKKDGIRNSSNGEENTLPQQILLPRLDESSIDLFVGRERESVKLLQNLAAGLDGRGRLLVIEGEMGVGKTRLAYHALQLASEQGATVISATCQSLERQLPYAPLADGIGRYLQELPLSSLRHLPMASLSQLAQIIPSLQDRLPSLPVMGSDHSISPEENRQRLVDGIVSFLAALARLRPLVLFLDDLHWSDSESISVLSRLSRRAPELPILIILAYRRGDLVENEDLIQLLRAMRRLTATQFLALERLDFSQVQAYVEQLVGDSAIRDQLASALYSTTLGNPLFLAEAVRSMQELFQATEKAALEGGGPAQPGAITQVWHSPNGRSFSLRGNPRIQEIIQDRIERLPPQALDVLYLSATIGRDFSLELLENISSVDLVAGLDVLLHRQFLIERPDGRLDFSHQVVRQVAYDSLSSLHRRRLHHRVADGLAQHPRVGQNPGEAAFHYGQAGLDAQVPYVRYSVLAGENLLRTYGFRQAIKHFDDALQSLDYLVDAPADLMRRALSGRGLACEGLLDPEGMAESYRRLRRWASQQGDQALMLMAHSRLASVLGLVGQQRESNALLRELLGRMGPTQTPIMVDLVERHQRIFSPDPAGAVDTWAPYEPPPEVPQDPVAAIQTVFEPVHAVLPLWEYGWILRLQGQLTEAEGCLQASARIAEETGQLPIASMAFHQLSVLARMRGQEEVSQQFNQQSIALNRQTQGASIDLLSLWPRISSAFEALRIHNLDEAEGRLTRVLTVLESYPSTFRSHRNSAKIGLALVHLERGQVEMADLLLQEALTDPVYIYPYTFVQGLLGKAQISQQRGDDLACSKFLREALRFAGRRSLIQEYATCCMMIARLQSASAPADRLLSTTLAYLEKIGFVWARTLVHEMIVARSAESNEAG